MENGFFIYSKQLIEIERFHLCSWEFKNGTALIEIGCEISSENLSKTTGNIELDIYIPWLNNQNNTSDLFSKLRDQANSKFIFNDSVVNTESFDGGQGLLGVLHEFKGREPLCILPITITQNLAEKNFNIKLNLSAYKNHKKNANIYFRFSTTVDLNLLSIRKKGITRSTIIYDIKINEERNLPDILFTVLQNKQLCPIKNCFSFTIVPNSYDLSFFDSSSLKNVRTLEFEAFNRYLGDRRVKKDQLMVVFIKKKYPESFSFFSIFTRERIGAGQFALAILLNLISGILLYLPNFRKENNGVIIWCNLPVEVFIAVAITITIIIYFIWPSLVNIFYFLKSLTFKKQRI